jgi:FkbM family methyltransferase
MKRKSGIIMPVDPAFIQPDFVFPEKIEVISPDLKRVSFPGGFSCYTCDDPSEAALIYNEIMVRHEYFQHGFSVEGAHCVFDVGANIGIFTMAVKLMAPNSTVYAFEPIQDTFKALEQNILAYGWSDVHTYNVAIGSQDGTEKTFTYYPHTPGNTTATPDLKLTAKPVIEQIFGKEAWDYMFEVELRVVPVRTISAIIQEEGITSIDYLKLDVEGDEFHVLNGISELHWPMIRQMVVEVHTEKLKDKVSELLVQHGFELFVDHGLSSPMNVSNVYARRP